MMDEEKFREILNKSLKKNKYLLKELVNIYNLGDDNMTDKVGIKGKVKFTERDSDTDEILNEDEYENIIVEDGADAIAEAIQDGSISTFDYMAVGDGATSGESESDIQSSLQNELERNSVTGTIDPDDDGSDHKIEWESTFGDGLGTVTEFGMFDADTDGTMLNYVIPEYEKDAQESRLQVTYILTVNYG